MMASIAAFYLVQVAPVVVFLQMCLTFGISWMKASSLLPQNCDLRHWTTHNNQISLPKSHRLVTLQLV